MIENVTLIETIQVRPISIEATISITIICIFIILFSAINLYHSKQVNKLKDNIENTGWIVISFVVVGLVWNFYSQVKTQYKVEIDNQTACAQIEKDYEIIHQEENQYLITEK